LWSYSYGYGYGMADKKPRVLSPEEREARRLASLRRAVADLDRLLDIPVFASRPQGLLSELLRCHFFFGEPTCVIRALCSMLQSSSGGGGNMSPALHAFFTQRCQVILREVVPALQHPADVVEYVLLLESALPRGSEMSVVLTHHVARLACGNSVQPALAVILRQTPLWAALFRSRGTEEADWPSSPAGDLAGLLRHVVACVTETAEVVARGTVTLSTLHAVSETRESADDLIQLLRLLGKERVLSRTELSARVGACARFDATLAQVKCYVHFFCNCGVRIDAQVLSDLIARLTLTYDALSLQDANEFFSDVDVVVDGSVAWLFQLRSSALFLALWRRVGRVRIRVRVRV
jgi:hypothetical protein